jgi:hypothetical protein
MGQVCNEAGRVGASNFTREGLDYLTPMLDRQPNILNIDKGVRAVYEHARLEAALERTDRAIEIATAGVEAAKKKGWQYLVNIGNRLRREILGGSTGRASAKADPDVLKGVADSLYVERRFPEAIATYERVIAAVPRTAESFEKYLLPCWTRISTAYREQGDLLAAALALDAAHEAWVDGLVPHGSGPDDPKMIEFGGMRLTAIALWRELWTQTDSPAFKARYTEMDRAFPTEYPDHPGGKLNEWRTAHELYTEGIKQQKARDPRAKATLAKSAEAFRKVAADLRAEKQDAALVYLIMICQALDDWAGMLKEYEAAMAYWNSPEAKEQAERFPSVRARRHEQRGYARFWAAEAHYQLKHYDEVLAIAEDWRSEFEGLKDRSNGFFYNGILGLRVLALLEKGDIEGADKPYRRLLRDDPGFWRLQAITFRLADHYNSQQEEIRKRLKEVLIRLKGSEEAPGAGVRTQARALDHDYTRALLRMADQQEGLKKDRELVELFDEAKRKGEPLPKGVTQEKRDEAAKRVAELEARLPQEQEAINEMAARKDALETEAIQLSDQARALAQELYEPLTKAAQYYTDYVNALLEAGRPVERENLRIFGDLWYQAGTLRPAETANWENARSLYERYVAAAGGRTDDALSEVQGKLGRIYYRLAVREQDAAKRSKLVQEALQRLEGAMTHLPENLELVGGHLKGSYVVIPYTYSRDGQKYRFALPRVGTVDEFLQAVRNLGKPGGTPIPKHAKEEDTTRHAHALRAFQEEVNLMARDAVERTVREFARAGFDAQFYAAHANVRREFRAALAWVYAESGTPDDAAKAVNLAWSLTDGPGLFAAEEDGEEWWDAQIVRLKAYIAGARHLIQNSGGSAPPQAVEWVETASKILQNLRVSFPRLGRAERPQTPEEMKALLADLNGLRQQLNLPVLVVDLSPPMPVAPPPPGDGAPADPGAGK